MDGLPRKGLNASVATGVILAATGAAFWPSLLAFDAYWGGLQDRSYGYFVVGMTLVWLIFLRRELAHLDIRPQPILLPLFLLTTAVWLIAWRGNSDLIHQTAFLALMIIAVFATAGRDIAWRIAPAVGYLLFALPIWEHIVPVLQRLTIVAAQTSMGLLDVPVSVSGALITIPEGTFEVEEGCSGKRYLMVTMAIATVAGAMNRLPFRRQALLLPVSALLALVANWVRVIFLIYLGHATNMQHYFVAVEHFSLGYVIFGVLLIAVSVLAFRAGLKPSDAASATSGIEPSSRREPRSRRFAWVTVLVLLAFTGSGVTYLAARGDEAQAPKLGGLPQSAGRWQGPLPMGGEWQPHFVGMSDEQQARYSSGDGDVYVYRNIYGPQRPGSELIYWENTPFAPGEWQRPSTGGFLTAAAAMLGMAPDIYVALSPDGNKWVMKHVYTVGGWQFRQQVSVQAAYGLRAIAKPVPAGMIAVASRCGADCEVARRRIEEFWNDYRQPLLSTMPDKLSSLGGGDKDAVFD